MPRGRTASSTIARQADRAELESFMKRLAGPSPQSTPARPTELLARSTSPEATGSTESTTDLHQPPTESRDPVPLSRDPQHSRQLSTPPELEGAERVSQELEGAEGGQGGATELEGSEGSLRELQKALGAAEDRVLLQDAQALAISQLHRDECAELRAQVAESEAEAAEQRRKLAEMEARMKRCATQEAGEMASLRLQKTDAEAQVQLLTEQLKGQEEELNKLTAAMSECTQQLQEHSSSDHSVLHQELRVMRSKLATAEEDAAQRLTALRDTRETAALAAEADARRISQLEDELEALRRETSYTSGDAAGQQQAFKRRYERAEQKLANEQHRNSVREGELAERNKELARQLEAAYVEVSRGVKGREAAVDELELVRSLEAKVGSSREAEQRARLQLVDAQEQIRRLGGSQGGLSGSKREVQVFEGAEREMRREIRMLREKVAYMEDTDRTLREKASLAKQLDQANQAISTLKKQAPPELGSAVREGQLLERQRRVQQDSPIGQSTPQSSLPGTPASEALADMRTKHRRLKSQLTYMINTPDRVANERLKTSQQDLSSSPNNSPAHATLRAPDQPERSQPSGIGGAGVHGKRHTSLASQPQPASPGDTPKPRVGCKPTPSASRRYQLDTAEQLMLKRAGI